MNNAYGPPLDLSANGFLQRIFAQRKRLRCELALLKNNGARIEVQIEGLLLRGEADHPELCLATMVDITERKQAERERERLILELQDALKKVKALSGLLPICSQCKKSATIGAIGVKLKSTLCNTRTPSSLTASARSARRHFFRTTRKNRPS